MTIRYISASGAGLVQTRDVPDGTTIGQFFSMIHGESVRTENYVILVNGEQPVANHVLVDGDEVVISPAKVAGA